MSGSTAEAEARTTAVAKVHRLAVVLGVGAAIWLVTLVVAPLLAALAPLQRTAAVQVYLLGVLGVVLSTFRAETPKLISDAPPLIAAALAIGLVVWAHPQRRLLLK